VTELGVPVWSEAPGPCWDPASPGRSTTVEQAGFVWQALAEAFGAGAERVFLFQLYDDCGNGPASYDAFGLVRNHAGNRCWEPPAQGCWNLDAAGPGTPRPAFEALKTAASLLHGARPVGSPGGTGAWSHQAFARADGARVTVAWATRGGSARASLPAAGARATLYSLDEAGRVTTTALAATAGRLGPPLAGVTNHNGIAGRPLFGGRPVILVEGGAAGASVAAAPGPAAGAGAAPGGGAGAAPAPPPAPAGPPDKEPPALAALMLLPPVSTTRVQLTVVAGDLGSGLGAVEVYGARGPAAPTSATRWERVVAETPWPGNPRHGSLALSFIARHGEVWHLAARARDAAGNWQPIPSSPQTRTQIVARGGGRR
jgi:hypothetical protein